MTMTIKVRSDDELAQQAGGWRGVGFGWKAELITAVSWNTTAPSCEVGHSRSALARFCVAARQCGKLAQTRTGFTRGDGAQEAKEGISSSVGSSLTGWRRGTARKHCAQFATFGHSEEIRTVLTASDC